MTDAHDDTGTFCPRCGKLRDHPSKTDATVTVGLDVPVDWHDTDHDRLSDLYVFVNHCVRCGYVLHTKTGSVLPQDDGTPGPRSIDTDKETFNSLDEYETWLTTTFTPIDEDWTDEPITIDTDAIISELRHNASEKRAALDL